VDVVHGESQANTVVRRRQQRQIVHHATQGRGILVDADPQDVRPQAGRLGADDHPCLGTTRTGGKDNVVDGEIPFPKLARQLSHGLDVASGADGVGPAVGDHVGRAAGGTLLRGHLVHHGLAIARARPAHARPEQMVKKQVAG